jgi:hypothetical protein
MVSVGESPLRSSAHRGVCVVACVHQQSTPPEHLYPVLCNKMCLGRICDRNSESQFKMTEHTFSGNWTEVKLARLAKYLAAYRMIFTHNERARPPSTFVMTNGVLHGFKPVNISSLCGWQGAGQGVVPRGRFGARRTVSSPHFAIEICSMQSPVFPSLPATGRNLPFAQ